MYLSPSIFASFLPIIIQWIIDANDDPKNKAEHLIWEGGIKLFNEPIIGRKNIVGKREIFLIFWY